VGELDGVAQQVQQHLAQAFFVDLHGRGQVGPAITSNTRSFSCVLMRMMSPMVRRNAAMRPIGYSSSLPARCSTGRDVVDQRQQQLAALFDRLQTGGGALAQVAVVAQHLV